jgi:alcohol dehydrogenase class IV
VLGLLESAGVETAVLQITAEPSVETIRAGVRVAIDAGSQVVVGFGGGSVLDAGKGIAAIVTNGGDPYDYIEVLGKGKRITELSLPYVACPTTAGTGTEVTRNAVLTATDAGVKASLRSPTLLPRVAIIDPETTYSLPSEVTARTGLDALAQLIEPFLSRKANPFTDLLCREGIRRSARSLRAAYADGQDPEARADLAFASMLSGMALANAGLGAIHGFAAPIGGSTHAPHGALCASLLPHVMRVNLDALRQRAPGSGALRKIDELAQLVTGNSRAAAEDGLQWMADLVRDLGIPSLSGLGVDRADFAQMVEKASVSSSLQGNPIALTRQELERVLELAH